ncbi:MAG: PilZ domain-containing protein [Gammaproteobacteria bacterium]|nr:PilZ domain-containing protein [Gammaproteobacteria bacterium]
MSDTNTTSHASLQVIIGPHTGRHIELTQHRTQLAHPGTHNVTISCEDEGYYLSYTGTGYTPVINNQDVDSEGQLLANNDLINIGAIQLKFILHDTQSSQDQQRQFSRIPFSAVVNLSSGRSTTECKLIDISLRGALIERPDELSSCEDDHYLLTLSLSESEKISMVTRVTRINDNVIGLVCKDIDLDSITNLRRLIELNLGDHEMLERELGELGELN